MMVNGRIHGGKVLQYAGEFGGIRRKGKEGKSIERKGEGKAERGMIGQGLLAGTRWVRLEFAGVRRGVRWARLEFAGGLARAGE
jgi:hypothetical protein